ncbi:ABC transporter substrate-binding protein [Tropicimonas sediminicola]|uniref:NitT/TauT family transport system substrate-binding protein n=1 Tax=Tropicimonas sediminicola TaxID=1031541 RepID=A0A239DGR0_9RHOB|nr:ABC transporter substrate-binding protein [Tropicimonas sediminicola]SNS31665.1 NitT/TauT family transport system substrate-binding protein [Tropicimonas sediminicola]
MSDMLRRKFLSTLGQIGLGIALSSSVAVSASAADKVKIGVFVASSALPYYVAAERGYFEEVDLEVEPVFIGTHPLIVQAMVSGDIDAVSNLVSLEGANINALRPDTMQFIALYGQNSEYVMEQFVVKPDSTATSIADLKGANLFSAPGPANLGAAKASLLASGLGEDEFRIQEQGMGNHIGAMQSGNFDGGYTLEALASIMVDLGIAKRLETGVIAKYLMKDETAEAYAAGAAVSGKLIADRPDVAKRFAAAWAKAVKDANDDPSARSLLAEMKVPENLTETVPLAHFSMVSDLSEAELGEFQSFVDIGVDLGVVAEKIDVADITEAM